MFVLSGLQVRPPALLVAGGLLALILDRATGIAQRKGAAQAAFCFFCSASTLASIVCS